MEREKITHRVRYAGDQFFIRRDVWFEMQRLDPQGARTAFQLRIEAPDQAIFVEDRQTEIAPDALWFRLVAF